MATTTTKKPTTAAALEALQRELEAMRRDLTQRISVLEERVVKAEQQQFEAADEREEVTPDTIAVIAACVTAYLGKKVRVRSAKRIYSAGSNWAQQGRAIVQASHNLSR
jgi:peptidoglycan hydrolase CwlO-like protein